MTEKRFVIPNQMRVIRDTVTGEEATFYDTEDGLLLKEWLNGLYEENEQLKQQLKTKVIVNRQYEELQRVKKENEQLREHFIYLIATALEDKECRKIYAKGLLEIFDDCANLNEAKIKIKEYLE